MEEEEWEHFQLNYVLRNALTNARCMQLQNIANLRMHGKSVETSTSVYLTSSTNADVSSRNNVLYIPAVTFTAIAFRANCIEGRHSQPNQ